MRVIGGKYRGKKLITPADAKIRPTTDRMRETVFNILEHGTGPGIRGALILDLFAGTGALGIEALSRGAKHVTFADHDPASLKLTRQNLSGIRDPENYSLVLADSTKISGKIGPFDIIFMDPPYHKDLLTPTIRNISKQSLLSAGGIIIIEYASDEQIDFTGGFEEVKRKKIGDATFSILQPIF